MGDKRCITQELYNLIIERGRHLKAGKWEALKEIDHRIRKQKKFEKWSSKYATTSTKGQGSHNGNKVFSEVHTFEHGKLTPKREPRPSEIASYELGDPEDN